MTPTDTAGSALSRRHVMLGLSALALSGCVSTPRTQLVAPSPAVPPPAPSRPMMYDAMPNEQFFVPAVDVSKVDPAFWRREVPNTTNEPAGTLVVDTDAKYLFFTQADGSAMRYGIGVGREGFSWSGRARVQYKRKWPTWKAPDDMVARNPELEPYSVANGGMEPGLMNPLGARALYLFDNGEDTLYRIHGNPEAHSIGQAVSSGCIRLLNQDIIDLYERVENRAKVIVLQPNPAMSVGLT